MRLRLIEFRIGATHLEWRIRRMSWRGWRPRPERHDAIELAPSGGLSRALASCSRRRAVGRHLELTRAIVDDALVEFATVPGLPDAKSFREHQAAARLRSEVLFGWTPDLWSVGTAAPSSSGPILVCASRKGDLTKWLHECNGANASRPALVPNAVYALNMYRRRVASDARVVVLSQTSCVGLLVRHGEVQAATQTRLPDCESWRDGDVLRWLDTQSVLNEDWKAAATTQVIDTRVWHDTRMVTLQ